jgi:predicted flavoprotein YhiN
MNQRNNHIKNRTISDLLDGLMNYKLVNLILKLSQINKETNWNNIPENKKIVLGNNLINFTLNITGTNSFDSSQTCTGGIPLTEINLTTMESLIMKDIYFAGEIIDIDGECGGYNLTNAWITGMLAGKGVNNDKN